MPIPNSMDVLRAKLAQGGVDSQLAANRQGLEDILELSKKTAVNQRASGRPIVQKPQGHEAPPLLPNAGGSLRHLGSSRGGAACSSAARGNIQSNGAPPYSQSLIRGNEAMALREVAAPASSQPSTFKTNIRLGTWDSGPCTLTCTEELISWISNRPVPGTNSMKVSMRIESIRDVLCSPNAMPLDIKMNGQLLPEDINDNVVLLDFYNSEVDKYAQDSEKRYVTLCFNTTLDLQSFVEAVPKINAAKKAQRVGPDQSAVKSTTTMKAISSRGPCNSIQAGTSRPSRGQRMQQEGFGNHAAAAAKNAASLFSPVPQSMLAPRKSARNQSGSGKNYAERNDDDDDDVEITNLRQDDNRTFGRATRTSSDSALLELPPRRPQNMSEKVLIYPNEQTKDAITLTREDLWRLSNKEFLNDSLVDFYLKFLQGQLRERHPMILEKCHFFNSFFYKRLLHTIGRTRNPSEQDRRDGYKLVRRWAKVNLFEKDYIFVPINESLHWSLAIICRPGAFIEEQLKQQAASAPPAGPFSEALSQMAAGPRVSDDEDTEVDEDNDGSPAGEELSRAAPGPADAVEDEDAAPLEKKARVFRRQMGERDVAEGVASLPSALSNVLLNVPTSPEPERRALARAGTLPPASSGSASDTEEGDDLDHGLRGTIEGGGPGGAFDFDSHVCGGDEFTFSEESGAPRHHAQRRRPSPGRKKRSNESLGGTSADHGRATARHGFEESFDFVDNLQPTSKRQALSTPVRGGRAQPERVDLSEEAPEIIAAQHQRASNPKGAGVDLCPGLRASAPPAASPHLSPTRVCVSASVDITGRSLPGNASAHAGAASSRQQPGLREHDETSPSVAHAPLRPCQPAEASGSGSSQGDETDPICIDARRLAEGDAERARTEPLDDDASPTHWLAGCDPASSCEPAPSLHAPRALVDLAADVLPASPTPPSSCILYIDSLSSSREDGINILKYYLEEEWKSKVRTAATFLEDPQFRNMPTKQVRVTQQHNHSDCGLYMLKYIEKFSLYGSMLEPPLEGQPGKPKWNDYEKLQFGKAEIEQMRKQMHKDIEQLGKEQRGTEAEHKR